METTTVYQVGDLLQQALSNYQGSKHTFNLVARQIQSRWGTNELRNYDPYRNCLTFQQWRKRGYRVRRNERAIKSFTLVERENDDGIKKKFPKTVNLFYYLQVEKANY